MPKRSDEFSAEIVLSGLKDFQRRTVEHVFERLRDPNGSRRFLVADEVGLGKTLVARGIIAKTFEASRKKGQRRVDVVYICANSVIAAQNANRLAIPGLKGFATPKRLTLLAKELKRFSDDGLNILCLTPGTNFEMAGSRRGIVMERAVICRLLAGAKELALKKTPLENIFRIGIEDADKWKERVRSLKASDLDPKLSEAFVRAVSNDKKIVAKLYETLEMTGRTQSWHRMEQGKKDQILSLVSALRAQLTEASLRFIKPSLIIFDEFHRFKNLLPSETEEGDEAAELAKPLFKRADSSVLLMSATPYKMYTLDLEAEDHHQDFLHTIGILFGSRTEKAERVGEILRLRRQELNRWGSLKPDPALKSELEETLLEVMCRTERIRGSSQAAPMLEETEKILKVTPGDIMDMAAADAVASAAKAACPVEYWKSAPYLLNFLRDYDLRRKLDAAAMKPSKELLDALEKALPKTLPGSSLSGWEKIDPANPRMRALFERTLDRGMWRLLWMPASLPYSLPAGPWSDLADATKTLIFSRWRAVPESISALCSYEAERLMAAESGKRRPYSRFVDDHAAPLRIASRSFTPASLNALGWMLPWPALALSADPLELALENKGPLPLKKMRSLAQAKIRPLLKELPRHGGKGPSDQRWYWAAAGMLENASTSSSPGGAPGAWPSWLESDQCSSALSKDEEKGAENVKKRLANLAALAGGQWETLGPKPADIEKVLADMALAGPGICALRAMGRLDPRCPPEKAYRNRDNLSRAASIASGLRTLFNLAETESLLGGPPAASYFQAALKCSLEGNLQAVLDEHAHILWDSTGPSQDPSDRLLSVEENLTSALSLRAVSETIDFLETSEAKLKIIPRKTRRRFALSFLETTCAKSAQEDRENKRHERVRTAFNSPFRPFVLASTSIGQEGLDFHSWCHAVVHWNLPSNPVDLEQREGRVDRYKGYAVRKNIAASYGLKALSKLESVKDPWEALFRLAAADRPEGASELAPYWIFENGPAKIERVIPLPVLSRDVAILRRLKRGLALYRMVFGQSRQEDLALSLERSIEKTENADFSDWLISLEPPKKGGPGVSR